MMSKEVSCPVCGQRVDPQTQHCQECGIDLALALMLVGRHLVDAIPAPAGAPMAPEMLVPRLGDYLLERGFLSEVQLKVALDFQQEQMMKGQPRLIGQALLELGLVNRETLDQVITEQILRLQDALQQANHQLEQRVQERTLDLQNALSKLSQLSRLKSDFISNISHELRTPLTHIKGYLTLLSDGSLGQLTDLQADALSVIYRAEERLEKLINDLIQFSQAASGEFTLKLGPVNLPGIIDQVVRRSLQRAEAKQVVLQVELLEDLQPVYADEEKISWVLLQLLDNAIKFTPSGGTVSLKAEPIQDMVKVGIEDTGIGIPPHRIEEIFEPFHQLDSSSTRQYNGTGLGLALVKNIIEAHGSLIKVRSEIERGSVFEFVLPYANNNQV
jgi:signal transduction histidine kinase